MAGSPKNELSEKHWKALKLFEAGGKSRKEIAEAIGVSVDYLYDLINGDVSKAGLTADLFKKEWSAIEQKRDDNIQQLVKENTELVQGLMLRVVKELNAKKRLSHDEKKLLNMYNNSLATNVPAVSIKSLSYSYVSGITPEDLIHEFTKLKTIAEGSFNRRRVQSTGSSEPGSLPAADEPGDWLDQDS